MLRVMVNRGPQFVQLMKGNPKRRSAGSSNSRRQLAQVAASAGIWVETWPPDSLWTMRNSVSPQQAISSTEMLAICASGGVSFGSRLRKSSTSEVFPSISMVTPAVSLKTAFRPGFLRSQGDRHRGETPPPEPPPERGSCAGFSPMASSFSGVCWMRNHGLTPRLD